MNDEPKHPKLKKNLKMMHNDLKKNLFDNLMDEIVDSLSQVYTEEVNSHVQIQCFLAITPLCLLCGHTVRTE